MYTTVQVCSEFGKFAYERTFHRCFLNQVSVHLAERFQRRRLKCEKLTDYRLQTTNAKRWQKFTLPLALARWANYIIHIYFRFSSYLPITKTAFISNIDRDWMIYRNHPIRSLLTSMLRKVPSHTIDVYIDLVHQQAKNKIFTTFY
jgi:hypothetical protein